MHGLPRWRNHLHRRLVCMEYWQYLAYSSQLESTPKRHPGSWDPSGISWDLHWDCMMAWVLAIPASASFLSFLCVLILRVLPNKSLVHRRVWSLRNSCCDSSFKRQALFNRWLLAFGLPLSLNLAHRCYTDGAAAILWPWGKMRRKKAIHSGQPNGGKKELWLLVALWKCGTVPNWQTSSISCSMKNENKSPYG